MDKIQKALQRLNKKERKQIKKLITQIQAGFFKNLDIKKLKGRDDIYRVRKGKLRIIYRIDKDGQTFILAIERRSEKTYKNL